MIYLILACEVGFWLFLVLGLAVRYLTSYRRAGLALLGCAPLVDGVLLVASVLSARSGEPMGIGHALAPVYIGFSVAYGHVLIRWTDVRFAHRFAGGPAPERPSGATYTRNCWRDVTRTLLAAVVASALTAAMVRIAGTGQAADVLGSNYRWMSFILGIDLLWAISYTIWPRKDTTVSRGTGQPQAAHLGEPRPVVGGMLGQ